ncbi:MAG: UbiA family prenyltransferase [Candidatus Zixiibacteriota bacterium]
MKALDLFFAARPMLHLPVWSVYLTSLHYHHKLSGGSFGGEELLVMSLLSLLIAGAYMLNQVTDRETDRLNNKLGFLQKGFLTDTLLTGAYLVVTVAALSVAPFISGTTLAIFVQIAVLGVLYSMPPFRLKDRPVAGMLANAYVFGWLIGLSVMPHITIHNAGLLGWDSPFYFFLSVAAIHVLTTLPDRKGDAVVGKRTIAVVWPRWACLGLALSLLIASALVAFGSGLYELSYVSVVSSIAVFVTTAIPSKRLELLSTKLPILLLTVLAAYWYLWYGLFIVVLIAGTRIYFSKRFGMVYPRLA